MNKTTKFSFFAVLLSFLILSAPSAHSADAQSDLGSLLPDAQSQKKQTGPDYLQMTYANLFRLAYALHVYKPSDTDALDSFLKISECKLYKNFYSNEFEWDKIRKATQTYFEKYDGQTSMYYEYVQPLMLGRYDPSLQGFPLQDAEEYVSLKALQLANFKVGDTPCGPLNVDAYKYPPSAAVNIISPLSLTFIRVSKELAEEYVAWRNKQGLSKSPVRQAYIRYRVRVDNYAGMQKVANGNAFIFNGRLMQVDVFADKEMLMPLYNQLF
jgi:hypothetical protein